MSLDAPKRWHDQRSPDSTLKAMAGKCVRIKWDIILQLGTSTQYAIRVPNHYLNFHMLVPNSTGFGTFLPKNQDQWSWLLHNPLLFPQSACSNLSADISGCISLLSSLMNAFRSTIDSEVPIINTGCLPCFHSGAGPCPVLLDDVLHKQCLFVGAQCCTFLFLWHVVPQLKKVFGSPLITLL